MGGPEVRIGGSWLTSLAPWSDLTITHRWPYGCYEASWSIPVGRYDRLRQFRAGTPVEVLAGSTPVFSGYLPEPDWSTGEMVALGLSRQGEDVLALTSANDLSSTADTAIDNAINKGWVRWVRGAATVSSLPFAPTEQQSTPTYLNDLIDASLAIQNRSWGVNARGRLFVESDPTVPSFFVTPDSGYLGISDETQADFVLGRYISDTTAGGDPVYSNVTVGSGRPQVGLDLTELGVMNAASATAKITAIRDQSQARLGWTDGLTLSASQLTTRGGGRVNLAAVRAGQMLRLQGLRDVRNQKATTDIVLGETVWSVDDATVICNPVAKVARDFTSVLEAAQVKPLAGFSAA